jgi:hypothetical protein
MTTSPEAWDATVCLQVVPTHYTRVTASLVSHLLTSALNFTVADITKTTLRRWLMASRCKTLDVEHLVQHFAVPSPSLELFG